LIVTGVVVLFQAVVAVKRPSNCWRAREIPGPNGLPAPTQALDGSSMIIVRPEESLITR